MSSIANLGPAATYGDLFQIANGGQGIGNVPGQVQDGLGNLTNISISSAATNFDRSIAQFQLDGVALTASANTLNTLSSVGNANYVLLTPNAALPAAQTLSVGDGLQINNGIGTAEIVVTGNLASLNALVNPGYVVQLGTNMYQTVYFQSDQTINITNPDGVAGNSVFSVEPDTVLERINTLLVSNSVSTRAHINFIPGMNVGIEVLDNVGDNQTDITISAAFDTGLIFKTAAYAGTVANLNATYNNGVAGVGATLTNAGALAAFAVDGVSPSLDARILVKNQAAGAQNGIYTLTTIGDGATAWVLTRATDFDTPANIQPGDFVITLFGTVNAGLGWVQYEDVNTVGTDIIEFVQFGLTGTVTLVSGTAGEIVVVDGSSTPIISIDPTYVGQTSITTLGTVTTGTWHGTPVTVPYGGTGDTTFTAYSLLAAGTTATGAFQNVATLGTANSILQSQGAGALPAWSTATYPATTTINQILYSSAANVVSGLATANNGVLLTDGTGVPSIGTATVPVGGTGNTTFTAYSIITAGTTATGAFQNVVGVGTAGQALISQGAGALPVWSAITPTSWVDQTGAAVTMAFNTSYITDNAGLVTLTLPTVVPIGTVFAIVGKGAGGWKIAQNAGQSIIVGIDTSTVGATGFVASQLATDCVTIVCTTANTTFSAQTAFGNLTIN